MLEPVACRMFDMARHVHSKEQGRAPVRCSDSIGAEKEPISLGKYDCLLPARAAAIWRVPVVPREPLAHRKEPVAFDHFKWQFLCLRADLWSLDIPLWNVTMVRSVLATELVLALLGRLIWNGRFQQEVHDAQSESKIACSGPFVAEGSGRDAGRVALGMNFSFERVRLNSDLAA